MRRRIIKTIYNRDGTNRVNVFVRNDRTFGFCEERFTVNSFASGWTPVLEHTDTYCATEEIVMREVAGRVAWFAGQLAQQSHPPEPAAGSVVNGESSPPAR